MKRPFTFDSQVTGTVAFLHNPYMCFEGYVTLELALTVVLPKSNYHFEFTADQENVITPQ